LSVETDADMEMRPWVDSAEAASEAVGRETL
jgi:hypothetical protein